MPISHQVRPCLVFIVLTLAHSYLPVVRATEHAPIAASGMNPFSIGHGTLQPQVWHVNGSDKYAIGLRMEVANYSIQSETTAEKIVLDGETYRTTVDLRYAFNERVTGEISLPWIRHASGFMDNGIEQWHDWFGLSNSRRADFTANQLHYEYIENGVSQIKIDDSTDGVGDISLRLSYLPLQWRDHKRLLSVNLDLKLPSGDADNFTGNGAFDWGVSMHAIKKTPNQLANFTLYGGLGLTFLGDGEVLAARQKDISYAAYSGIHWSPMEKLLLSTQLNLQSAFYESELDELGRTSAQLLIGGSYQARGGIRYQVAIGENMFTDATPDFSIYFAIHAK